MVDAIGFLEFSSIAQGMEAADAALKAAEVQLAFARPCCPGKFVVLFSGEVAAAKSALEAGVSTGGDTVVDSCLIPRVHPQVLAGVFDAAAPSVQGALGVMEFYSVTAAIYAADAAVKAADVQCALLRLAAGIGGKSFVCLTGEVSAVSHAVACGVQTQQAQGMVLSHVVIARPRPEILASLL
ncbi:MAG: BMC domain-containing protein [Oscillospiraceae bacterium]|nr:BMC domain-containing protein [Oscillospiraceae bacterium]